MIGAMQDFNFRFGEDSYIRFGFDFTALAGATGAKWLSVAFNTVLSPFNPNYPDANIKFYVNGLEWSEGVPYGGSQSNLRWYAPNIPNQVIVELKANGPYLERFYSSSNLVNGIFNNYFAIGNTQGSIYSMRYISFVDISDGSGFTTLGSSMLTDMRNINTLIFPATATSFANQALIYINPYSTMICKAKTPPKITGTGNVSLFSRLGSQAPYENITLKVPKGCAQIYKQPTIDGVANDWSNIQNIVELDY